MALQNLPRSILSDILERVLCDEDARVSESLALRLVNRHFNAEVTNAVFDRDVMKIHSRISEGQCGGKPTGTALQRFVRGFVLRPPSSSEVLNSIRRSLRDGVLIATILFESLSGDDEPKQLPEERVLTSAPSTDDPVSKANHQSSIFLIENPPDDEECLPEQALTHICKAYVDLLGDDKSFDSIDPSWERDPADFELLNDKPGHFWAFLAASLEGKPEIITKAAKACSDRFGDEEDSLKLKTHFAAGLLVMARDGQVEGAKALLAHPGMRINLRLQNIRFSGKNAFEAAVEMSQDDIVQLLLNSGWNLTTVPMDYVRALKAVVSSMKASPVRTDLFKTLLEGTSQQWRSDAIVNGMYVELSKRGDLETCNMVLSLLRQPHTTQYQWQWTFKDDATNESITMTPGPTDDDEEMFAWEDFINPEEKTALYFAVTNNYDDLIPFLFTNEEHFPESMSYTFNVRTRVRCLEYAIKHKRQDTFKILLAHGSAEVPREMLFLYATALGNVPAMTVLLPEIDLTKPNPDPYHPLDAAGRSSDLPNALCTFNDILQPNSFLFNISSPISLSVQLGTYALVCAIKALHVSAAQFLLDHNCAIGTRLIIVSPNVFETCHARLFLPHDPTSCSDCATRQPRLRGKSMLMLSFRRFSFINIKRMVEQGYVVESGRKTRCWTTRRESGMLSSSSSSSSSSSQRQRRWWPSSWCWRIWKSSELAEMGARILTAIQIPTGISTSISDEDLSVRQKEMTDLLRKFKMPDIYCSNLHE